MRTISVKLFLFLTSGSGDFPLESSFKGDNPSRKQGIVTILKCYTTS